jgi:hypothetical protein
MKLTGRYAQDVSTMRSSFTAHANAAQTAHDYLQFLVWDNVDEGLTRIAWVVQGFQRVATASTTTFIS